MGTKIAAPLSRASASWPFTNLGPSGCFGGIPIARQFGRRKLLIVCLRSAITPPLSFQQSLAPASIPHIVSGNESLPFADLPCLLRLSQPAAQSHAQTGSCPRFGDGRPKCRPPVDRNRIRTAMIRITCAASTMTFGSITFKFIETSPHQECLQKRICAQNSLCEQKPWCRASIKV